MLNYFDATDNRAHTWWNPRTIRETGKPEVTADGRTYVYALPVNTWGVVAAVRGEKDASAFAVPAVRALVPDVWKKMDVEIEWGFDDATSQNTLDYDGRIEAYDAIVGDVRPLAADSGTTMTGAFAWRSAGKGALAANSKAASGTPRRGVQLSVLYIGGSRWRRVWPYHAQPEDVARTILTVWTKSGSFSFQVADLEAGPMLAPEYGFFVRAASRQASRSHPWRRYGMGPTARSSPSLPMCAVLPRARGAGGAARGTSARSTGTRCSRPTR